MHTRRYAPEMAQMRDVAFLTKMMVTDPHSLRESLRKEEHGVVRRSWLKNKIINPSSLLPTWEVTSGVNLCLRWGPYADMVALHEVMPFRVRKESLATPKGFGLRSAGSQVNEDEVVHHMGNLPTFEGRLAEEDSERLMTYLTVPYALSTPPPAPAPSTLHCISRLVCRLVWQSYDLLPNMCMHACNIAGTSRSRWCSPCSTARIWARSSISASSASSSGCSPRNLPHVHAPMCGCL